MKIFTKLRQYKRSDYFAYFFLAPWLAGVLLLVAVPLVQSFYYSLCNVKITAAGRETAFVGIENYISVWVRDIYFIKRALNFILSSLLQVPLIVIFALLIALMLNSKIKGKGIFRTVFFLPVIVVSGPIINRLLSQGAATIPVIEQQMIGDTIGGIFPEWLAAPIVSLFEQLIMILWYSGVPILMFLTILQKIDLNMVEAARIDGATSWEIFWKITLPAIRPIVLLNTVYILVFLANAEQNEVIALISRSMLEPQRGYGFASAMAWIHAVIVLLLLGFSFLVLRRKSDRRIAKERMQ